MLFYLLTFINGDTFVYFFISDIRLSILFMRFWFCFYLKFSYLFYFLLVFVLLFFSIYINVSYILIWKITLFFLNIFYFIFLPLIKVHIKIPNIFGTFTVNKANIYTVNTHTKQTLTIIKLFTILLTYRFDITQQDYIKIWLLLPLFPLWFFNLPFFAWSFILDVWNYSRLIIAISKNV